MNTPYLQILTAAAGLILACVIVFVAPRLVAYRLEEGYSLPGLKALVPFAGPYLADLDPVRTLILEIGLPVVFVGLSLHYGPSVELSLAALYTALLAAIAHIDLEFRLVLNRLTYPGFFVALAGAPIWPGIGLQSAAAGAAIGLVAFGVLQIVGRGALGTGDTKLAVLIGAMRGFPGVLSALFYGILLGGLAALFLLVALRRGRKSFFAYAPYLALGAVLSFFLVSP